MDLLITWLWQGLLVAGGVEFALRLAPRVSAATRYAVWWVALGTVLGLPWVALLGSSTSGSVATAAAATAGLSGLAPLRLPAPSDELALVAVGLWLAVTVLRLTVLGWGVWRLQAIKRTSVAMPSGREARLVGWRAVRRAGRPARLRLSVGVRTAAVLGLTTPVIAIPPALEAALDDGDLDRVVLHEYAHVRRWDDWSRLAQMVVEVIAAFHPAVWVIGRRLDLEREVACDDWVLAQGTPSLAYATCLTKVAEVGRLGRGGLAPGITYSRHALVTRVDRLLDRRRNLSVRVSGGGMLACLGSLAIVVYALGQLSPLVAFERTVATDHVDRVGSMVLEGSPTAESFARQPGPSPVRERAELASADSNREGPLALPKVDSPMVSEARSDGVGVTGVGTLVGEPHAPSIAVAWERPSAAPHTGPSWRAGVMAETLRLPVASRSSRGPWAWAADVAASVGGGTKRASLATAGYFTRVGKSVARAF